MDKPSIRIGDTFLVWGAAILVVTGFVFVVAYGSGISAEKKIACVSALALLGLSASAAASVLGFLFGIPRSRVGGSADGSPVVTGRFDENTNLEQLSDWLTKVLVGVGLTQLTSVPLAFQKLIEYVCSGIPSDTASPPVVGAVILYFAMWGFLSAYVITRIYFRELLTRFEESAPAMATSTVVTPGRVESVVVSMPVAADQSTDVRHQRNAENTVSTAI